MIGVWMQNVGSDHLPGGTFEQRYRLTDNVHDAASSLTPQPRASPFVTRRCKSLRGAKRNARPRSTRARFAEPGQRCSVRFELEQGATPAEVTEKHGISERQARRKAGKKPKIIRTKLPAHPKLPAPAE